MTTTPPATAGPARTRAAGRPGQGELRRKVAGWLAANPGAWKPGKIAGALGRSAGAVGNALATLDTRGEAACETAALPLPRQRRHRRRSGRPGPRCRRPSPHPAPPASPAPSGRHRAGGHLALAGREPGPGRPAGAASARRAGHPPERADLPPGVLADLPDVAALRRLRAAGIPALLYGPPGTGKTSLVEAAFGDLITVAGDGDTTVADFVGEYTQADGGGYEFVYGPLVTAMTEGRALLIDDATLISPKVLAVVYPAMDGRRQIPSRPTGARRSPPPTGSTSSPGTTPACTARS